jgi:hydroxymethylglutaryl-CoA lyase/(R)-citramalyl-CoA lyase
VADLARRFDGVEVVLADTIGVAAPREVKALVSRTGAAGFHGHNTRNTGYANALARSRRGRRSGRLVGGLGGCPYAPRASGNVATEDLVYLLEHEGVETGVDLDALIETATGSRGSSAAASRARLYRAGTFPA